MKLTVEVASRTATVGLDRGFDLATPISLDEAAPIAFGLPAPTKRAFEAGGFVGDTRRGGSANCFTITLTPHGDGTHTETVGHLVDDPVPVGERIAHELVLARVVTVAPARRDAVDDAYAGTRAPDDAVIAAGALDHTLPYAAAENVRALVVRTAPEAERRGRAWTDTNPPYLTDDAARAIADAGIVHLLLDVPSVDRENDGGGLSAHRAFFGLAPGQRTLDGAPTARTVTELIVVPDACPDGLYLLALSVPRLGLDAAPSRPVLYPLDFDDAG